MSNKNNMLENLAFPDDVSSGFLIFIIVSDLFYIEMILPSVASCDFARTHPPFLASYRSLKNLKKKTLQKVISCTCKVLIKSDISEPRRPKKERPFWTYISWVKSAYWMFFILGVPISIFIAFADALHLYSCILFSFANIPFETCRILSISIAFAHDLPWVSLCTRNPGFHSSNPRSARASLSLLPFRIALYT